MTYIDATEMSLFNFPPIEHKTKLQQLGSDVSDFINVTLFASSGIMCVNDTHCAQE